MRITGGVFRSRTLQAPRGSATRPTSDRVREALFSLLTAAGFFPGRGGKVLDLYAGTGSLALEAISRGAESAVLVEDARPALACLAENVRALGVADRVSVVASHVERALARLEGPFDLVFMDPPYAHVRQPAFATLLNRTGVVLTEEGLCVLEHATSDAVLAPDSLTLEQHRRYGDTSLSLFRRTSREPHRDGC